MFDDADAAACDCTALREEQGRQLNKRGVPCAAVRSLAQGACACCGDCVSC